MAKQLQFFLDPSSCKVIEDPKEYFFNMVSASLLKENKYYSTSDDARDDLIQTMNLISTIDPEFLLQTSYYVRNKMYIRTCSNFILAFCILNPKTVPFVYKYFNAIVLIPGDLLEVCQFVQIINLLNRGGEIGGIQDLRRKLYFPNVLKHCVASRIQLFTLYQLGKQCSESNRKKTLIQYKEFLNPEIKAQKLAKRKAKLEAFHQQLNQQGDKDAINQVKQKIIQRTGKAKKATKRHKPKQESSSEVCVFDIKFVTMKDIIRFCHVTQPKQLVMSIIGKKYPANEEEFNKQFGIESLLKYQPELSGKRMQVPIPITWDRELSSKKGSKTDLWTNLIQNNQVPYMALMRNLRNILKAVVDPQILKQVISTIQNEKKVESAKMFPLQYMSALIEVDQLVSPSKTSKPKVKASKQTEKVQEVNAIEEEFRLDPSIGENFKKAIEKAIQIAVDKNLDSIRGVTYVFCDVSGSMGAQISGGKKYGSIRTCMDCGFILGLMIKSKCQKCDFYLFAAPNGKKCYEKVEVDTSSLLESLKRCQTISGKLSGSHEMIGQTISDVLLKPKVFADNIIILSDMMITQGFSEENGEKFETVIKNYLKTINNNAKFFFMDISGYGKQATFGDQLKGKNCFTITGMSDQVFKYISLAGSLDQVGDVKLFSQNLKEIKNVQQKDQSNDLKMQQE